MVAAVAAIVDQAKREIQHHFFSADAVRADRAVAFSPSNTVEARQFEKMLERGLIMREAADRYWIDVVAYDVDLQQRYRRNRVVLRIVSIALVVVLIALAISSGHVFTR